MVSKIPAWMAILQLGADAVVGGHQHGIAKTGRAQVEQAAEAADLGVRAGAAGGAHQRLDRLHHGVAGVDVDARGGVGQGLRHVAPLSELAAPFAWRAAKFQ